MSWGRFGDDARGQGPSTYQRIPVVTQGNDFDSLDDAHGVHVIRN